MYNKWLLNDWHSGSDFPATFSMAHMFLKGVFALIAIYAMKRKIYRISLRDFLILACPIGLATGMDVVLANISLVIVTMSFYTLVKSATLLFMLAMVLCFRLDRFSWWLVVVCVVLVIGLIMTSFGETQFEVLGLVIAIISMVFGGLRWVLSEMLLHDKRACVKRKRSSEIPQAADKAKAIDPLSLVLLIAPASFLSIIPFVVFAELPNLEESFNSSLDADNGTAVSPLEFIGVSAIGAF